MHNPRAFVVTTGFTWTLGTWFSHDDVMHNRGAGCTLCALIAQSTRISVMGRRRPPASGMMRCQFIAPIQDHAGQFRSRPTIAIPWSSGREGTNRIYSSAASLRGGNLPRSVVTPRNTGGARSLAHALRWHGDTRRLRTMARMRRGCIGRHAGGSHCAGASPERRSTTIRPFPVMPPPCAWLARYRPAGTR